LPAYRLPSPYDRPPLRRRASGLALAIGVNLLLLLVLLGMGKFTPIAQKVGRMTIFNLAPESRPSAQRRAESAQARRATKPIPKPPPIVLAVKPTIAPPPEPPKEKTTPWVEMSKEDMAAADVSNLPKAAGSGQGDSEEVGRGPHGETLYAAEWARHPTDAELGGYLPANAPDGFGLIACKTIPGDRVEDCVELDQYPHGSRLAGAVRQAAWQFRIRPPRKNGRPMIGEWVQIRIDYEHVSGGAGR
jgi:protein TonB